MRHVSELLVPGFGRPVLLCRGRIPRARGLEGYVRGGYGPFRQPKLECGCCAMLVFGLGWVLQPYIVSVLQPLTSQLCLHGCDRLVVGHTNARGGTLEIIMIDVPDLVRVSVVEPISNSDHSSLSAVISMAAGCSKLIC